jgi:hypothetical protein
MIHSGKGRVVPEKDHIEELPGLPIRLPSPRHALIWLLIVGALMMPVNYRAGTTTEHTHTILQGIIDAIAGQPHTHPGAMGLEDGTHSAPDVPVQLGLSMPILSQTSLDQLGVLIALLLTGTLLRRAWISTASLSGWLPGLDPPPPRCA